MGTYTTVDKVKSLFRLIKIEADTGLESTNTALTTEEVEEFIDNEEAELLARLSVCYDTTSIGVESAKILGKIVQYKVAQVIKDILELTTSNSDNKTQRVTSNWYAKAEKILDDICPKQNCGDCKEKPTIPLPDTSLISDAPTGASLFNSSTNTTNFKKDTPNW